MRTLSSEHSRQFTGTPFHRLGVGQLEQDRRHKDTAWALAMGRTTGFKLALGKRPGFVRLRCLARRNLRSSRTHPGRHLSSLVPQKPTHSNPSITTTSCPSILADLGALSAPSTFLTTTILQPEASAITSNTIDILFANTILRTEHPSQLRLFPVCSIQLSTSPSDHLSSITTTGSQDASHILHAPVARPYSFPDRKPSSASFLH